MTAARRILVWCAVALAAFILLLFALPSYRQGEASIAGKTADNFSAEIAGKTEQLSDFKGKVVVLNFWATWCPPCVNEAPSMVRLQQYIGSRNGVVLGGSIDDDPAAYAKFLKDYGINF